MTKYVRNVANVATDVVTAPIQYGDFTIQLSDMFVPYLVAQFQVAPEEVEAGWLYDSAARTWSAPPIPELPEQGEDSAPTTGGAT